jgi:very-short-patch-repair endonuclease
MPSAPYGECCECAKWAGGSAANTRSRPYIVDFACLALHLVVEADGSQHALPGDHDRRDAFLGKQGWRVLRFWNNDILLNPAGVFDVIAEAAAAKPPP